jgi:hypothetical protein
MNTATETTMKSITFRFTESSRANDYHGTCDAVRTETIREDGHIEGRLVGLYDSRNVDNKWTREVGSVDLAAVREARIAAGWSVV